MNNVSHIYLLLLLTSYSHMCTSGTPELENGSKVPTVAITVLVRNKVHTLPQFLTSLMTLDYPKDRIFLWFRSDYNIDNSIQIIKEFIQKFGTLYNQVHFSYNSSLHKYDDEVSPTHWTPERYSHVIRWREWGVMYAKRQWADYVFMVDADVFFTNQFTLRQLVSKRLPVVAPMLVSDRYYSNFWLDFWIIWMLLLLSAISTVDGHASVLKFNSISVLDSNSINVVNANATIGWFTLHPFISEPGFLWMDIDENYSYILNEDDDYFNIYQYKEEFLGCHAVPMVYGAVLIDMRYHQADNLTYEPMRIPGYMGPDQDHIAFAINAKIYNLALRVCNDNFYGLINRPAREGEPLRVEVENFTNLKLLAISRTTPLQIHYKLEHFVQYPPVEDYQVDEIYMINLERRNDKRHLMELAFKELGMNVSRRDAVDGRILTEKKLREMNVTLMPGYEDPYYKRPMTYGEIGCFLSHYKIWVEMLVKRQSRIIIIEDDVNFLPNFKKNFNILLDESSGYAFDFMYLGRKILLDKEERKITSHLSKPLYSYWTLGYMLTDTGARKLVKARPLDKLMPVDEFLPIMFDQHPDERYNSFFPIRNLNAVSADPVIIRPTHFTGMPGYISDTEYSPLLPQQEINLPQNIDHMPHNLPRLPSQKLEF